jgi:hypothetical protein
MTTDQSILEELYALDPSLRQHEPRLKELIAQLRAKRPDATPDPQFLRELRVLLLDRAADLSAPRSSFFTPLSMSRFTYAVTGAILGVLVAGPTAYYLFNGGQPSFTSTGLESDGDLFSYSVAPTDGRAFGDLSQAQPQQAGGRGGGGAENMAMDAARPQSGGGGGVDAKLAIYPPVAYEYRYTMSGALPSLPGETVDVLKRQKGTKSVPLSAIASRFQTPFMDLETFDDAIVDSVTFVQNEQKGYMVSISAREGTLSVSQNWEKWPQYGQECRDEACWRRYRLTPNDLLPDAEVIRIAKAFADAHGIDLSRTGEPEVDSQWRVEYERMQDKSQAWVPDVQRVVFPFLVEGKPVYEEGGQKSGVSIGVHVREKLVSDVWGVMDHTYLSSAYPAVKDEQAIRDYVNATDRIFIDPAAMERDGVERKTVTVRLGAPELAYAKYFLYDNPNRVGEEVVVPSLVFPVENVEGDVSFWRKNIVVPLADDLLKQRLSPQDGQVMPLMNGRG